MSTDQSSNSSTQKGKSLSSIDTTRSKYAQELGIHQLLQNAFQDMDDENTDMKTLLPISILLEEMKSDHSSTRTYCLQNLSTIALVLGPARAKGLLGGFISNLLKDQEKAVEDVPEELQVMLTLLESMPKLINLIGGPENSLVLLKPLLETIGDRTKEETKNMYYKFEYNYYFVYFLIIIIKFYYGQQSTILFNYKNYIETKWSTLKKNNIFF